ncbi:nuclease-related domain-containing protein [Cytobacillus oceanisediminis]|uniref:nuclease-related domain-containing protein n=1 Tax=Cytobacillus oceanisediminis TaxID=665099 RepID=UPI001CF4B650|nr:nuclease-related domain-containing protein [Cytobacillus oceanisediminis]
MVSIISKLLGIFSKKFNATDSPEVDCKQDKNNVPPTRIGDLGEYKINIQLDQLPKKYRYLSDIMIPNPISITGFSQIDHIIISPYAIFVIETKNYTGTIYGSRDKDKWLINGKFPMVNPFNQNFGHIKAVQSLLSNANVSNIVSMVSFSRRCIFKVDLNLRKIQSNELIVYDTELSDFITRKQNVLRLLFNAPIYTEEKIQQMYDILSRNNITDKEIREQHIKNIKMNRKESESKSNFPASCENCGKMVSDKVRRYCLANKERFKGSIYCFEHQREI